MRRFIYILFLGLLSASISAQQYKNYVLMKDRLSIDLSEEVLSIIPLTNKSIGVQYQIGDVKEVRVCLNKQT
ncbi:hypothetical protein CLU83_0957 [Flavobacterium sp. 1]|uniref:hypothetical protein n=1 Tax=Flavobacterium sp. 1 TaxID=2035200 RepID=UPI000C232227|nr:hypothetical protein [Flavobacterium sp. 1]PJJ07756.1 hypothetical protein CLU83_0957 [Flavobacterium sp. 1]